MHQAAPLITDIWAETRMTSTLFKGTPPLRLNKGDSKYLTKLQIKKAQFLFENDYFIWNEAEMYLRVGFFCILKIFFFFNLKNVLSKKNSIMRYFLIWPTRTYFMKTCANRPGLYSISYMEYTLRALAPTWPTWSFMSFWWGNNPRW